MHDNFRRLPILEGLNSQQLEELVSIAILKEFAPKETIFLEDEPGDALYLIQEGAVKIHRVSHEGREQILAVLHPGDLFGEMAVLQRSGRSAAAQALLSSKVLVFPEREFRNYIVSYPQVALQIIVLLCQRLRRTNEHVELLSGGNVRQRLFVILREQAIKGKRDWEVRLTHQDLGALVGASRETITRILSELQEAECIECQRGRLRILHWGTTRQLLLENTFLDNP